MSQSNGNTPLSGSDGETVHVQATNSSNPPTGSHSQPDPASVVNSIEPGEELTTNNPSNGMDGVSSIDGNSNAGIVNTRSTSISTSNFSLGIFREAEDQSQASNPTSSLRNGHMAGSSANEAHQQSTNNPIQTQGSINDNIAAALSIRRYWDSGSDVQRLEDLLLTWVSGESMEQMIGNQEGTPSDGRTEREERLQSLMLVGEVIGWLEAREEERSEARSIFRLMYRIDMRFVEIDAEADVQEETDE